eukprot:TRINITY_DN57161_c0_g2_i4.p1 TRINITY_DN57161_c0_g2~~TRINITY_DN57161_c0_g2_i4.p1  ORF type:complete len:556 (-),score=137.64 TRINITY_DN57161_c0_g2_i4:1720-3387(-)
MALSIARQASSNWERGKARSSLTRAAQTSVVSKSLPEQIELCRGELLCALSASFVPKNLVSLDQQRREVMESLERLVSVDSVSEVQSLLLVGPEGTGKLTCVRRCLSSLKDKIRKDMSKKEISTDRRTRKGKEQPLTADAKNVKSSMYPFVVLYFDGDKIREKESELVEQVLPWIHLRRTVLIETDTCARERLPLGPAHTVDTISIEDTLIPSLVHDHDESPVDVELEDMRDIVVQNLGDLGDGRRLAHELKRRKKMDETKAIPPFAVIVVLRSFDRIAEEYPKFLYSLFDCQLVSIVGITKRVDAVDLLEKRVKSRFSHRQVVFRVLPSTNDLRSVFQERMRLSSVRTPYRKELRESIDKTLESSWFNTFLTLHHDIGTPLNTLMQMMRSAVLMYDRVFTVGAIESAVSATWVSPSMEMLRQMCFMEWSIVLSIVSMRSVGAVPLIDHVISMLDGRPGDADRRSFTSLPLFLRPIQSFPWCDESVLRSGIEHLATMGVIILSAQDGTFADALSGDWRFMQMELSVSHLEVEHAFSSIREFPTSLMEWGKRIFRK